MSSTTVPVRWRHAVAFEWTKLASVRSTWWCLSLALVVAVGLSALFGVSAKASGDNGYESTMPAPLVALSSLQAAQLLLLVFATLAMSVEFSTGTIVSSLQAVPLRGRFLLAKAAVVAAVSAVLGVVLVAGGTLAAAPTAQEYGQFTGGDLAVALGTAALYFAALSLVILGLATILRSAAGTIAIAFVLLYGLPQILPLVDVAWVQVIPDYLPSTAAAVLSSGGGVPYSEGVAAVVLCAWAAGSIVAAWLVLRRRDA